MSTMGIAEIDIRTEQLLSLRQLAGSVPPYRQNRPVNASTIWRWCHRGVKLSDGSVIKLDCVRLAGRWLSSKEALGRFLARQTPSREAPPAWPAAPETPRARRKSEERARRAGDRLQKHGIG
jgi:hypothetical protein